MKADRNRVRAFLDGDHRRQVNDTTECLSERGSRSAFDQMMDPDAPSIGDSQFDQRLASLLDNYLRAMEAGTPVDIEEFVSQYPKYAEELREYLSGLNLLNLGFSEITPASNSNDETSDEETSNDERGRLGDYDIIREVARGGMGVVYEAHQISLDRRVALKVLPFAAMLDKRQIIRFENEARAAAQLHHPHIVPVYGVGCDRGVHYFVMQFINGQSVHELLDVHKQPPNDADEGQRSTNTTQSKPSPRDVVRLGIQAANALKAAHQCGVVHRDIKPSNLMLDERGELWITDFGLARCQTDQHITRSGDLIGTLHYMSPEQVRGGAIADPRMDIYSLGVTLYEMVTLRRPFEDTTTNTSMIGAHAGVLRQIEHGACKPVRHWNPSVPRDLENVIAKAMAVEPADRYQTAGELEEDLRRFANGEATQAKPPSAALLLSRWAARNRRLVMVSIVGMVCICLLLAASTLWLANERAKLAVKHQKVDRQLETTETTFERFGLATAERLKHLPGSESARHALLTELLEHYQTLLSESADTPSLRQDRAVTSTKIATVHREAGELEQAVNAYRAAESELTVLSSASPANRDYAAQLAKCLSSVSVVLAELGDAKEARRESQRAIGIQMRLLEAKRDAPTQLALASSYVNLGLIENEDNSNAAIGCLEYAASVAEEAREIASGNELVEAWQCLATIYANLSAHLRAVSISDAILSGQRAVDCTRLLIEVESTSPSECITGHARNCNNLATLYMQQGEPTKAVGLYEEAASMLAQANDRETLVVTLSNLAKTQHELNRPGDAVGSYRKAIAAQSDLLLNSPANLNHVSRLGGLHNNLAFTWCSLGKLDDASVSYEAAVEYQHRAFELAPPNIGAYRDALSRTFFNAARASLDAGRPYQAAELQRRRGELWPTDAEQLFSVASSIAVAVSRMPDDDPRGTDWRRTAEHTLRKALEVDQDRTIDADRAKKLARFLSQASARS